MCHSAVAVKSPEVLLPIRLERIRKRGRTRHGISWSRRQREGVYQAGEQSSCIWSRRGRKKSTSHNKRGQKYPRMSLLKMSFQWYKRAKEECWEGGKEGGMSGGRECLYRTNQGSSNGNESVLFSVAEPRRMAKWRCFPFCPAPETRLQQSET